MTCEEKYRLEHGSSGMSVSTPGCPNDHGYLPTPDYCEWPFRHAYKCVNCWNREIPENNENNKENDEMKKEIGCNTEATAYEEMEGEWTRTEVEAVRERSSAEIKAEMKELHNEYRRKADILEHEFELARKREELDAAAVELKALVDSYISAGFTREEAMTIVLTNIKALSIN